MAGRRLGGSDCTSLPIILTRCMSAAVKLIKKGKAYVCDLSAEEIREYRGTLTEPGKEQPLP